MNYSSLYNFLSTSFSTIVTALSSFLVSLLVTPFPTLLSNLSADGTLPDFVSTALSELSSYISGIPIFTPPLLVILLGTFLLLYCVLAIVRWLIP